MQSLSLLCTLTFAVFTFFQGQSIAVGPIDFYGYAGLDLNKIRAALPLREGDLLSRESRDITIEGLKRVITQETGREPSDVGIYCCDDRGRLTVFIGLTGESIRHIQYNPVPQSSMRLPPLALKVHQEANEAWSNAMQRGVTGEDDSRGYALSLDPKARAKQLALRAYVVRHVNVVRRVLESARDAEQRQVAAEMLGYAERSPTQIRALVRAGQDADEVVRNNSVRALSVIANSNSRAAAMIPAENFIELLNSGIWTDRNKAAALLSELTAKRDPVLLERLRAQALTSLIEMARWHSPGHAFTARLLLGRIAGIDENVLMKMIVSGEPESIISALSIQKK